MAKNQDVRFIRKNGRIIPIKMSKETKERVIGSAGLATGVAIAATVGKAEKFNQRFITRQSSLGGFFGGLSAQSRHFAKSKIKGQMTFDDLIRADRNSKRATKFGAKAKRHFKFARAAIKTSQSIRPALLSVATGLTTAGVLKIMKGDKKVTASDAATAATFGAAASGSGLALGYHGKKAVPLVVKTIRNLAKSRF